MRARHLGYVDASVRLYHFFVALQECSFGARYFSPEIVICKIVEQSLCLIDKKIRPNLFNNCPKLSGSIGQEAQEGFSVLDLCLSTRKYRQLPAYNNHQEE